MAIEAKTCIWTRPEDEYLQPLLESWLGALDEYSRLHREFGIDDNPWWHNERASISLLAGAAWRKGWVALEEFGTSKRGHKIPSEERGERVGRCDLYVTNREVSIAMEAKQAWQRIGYRSQADKEVRDKLQSAWGDTGYLHAYEADKRFAATFIVPNLPASEVEDGDAISPTLLREKVLEWLELMAGFCRRPGKPVSFAYFFPSDGERYWNDYTGTVYPGVVLVMEERVRGG
ncbi:hypothetical protein J8402_04270 [Chromohalobacter israelensis]|uniref:hypothetical protein n=1 Tax=Chromohalobacter israelensis TaxID=141390 RepID=UPI003AF45279